MGLEKSEFFRGAAALDGAAPAYELMGLLTFGSGDQLSAALTASGAEILADIPNFTNVQPFIQVNEAVSW